MKLFKHKDYFYIQTNHGEEFEVDIDYDFTPAEKADLEYPGCDAEFIINEVRLDDSGFPIELDWIENLLDFSQEQAATATKKRRFWL